MPFARTLVLALALGPAVHAVPEGVSGSGLVVSEIMYWPGAPTESEREAGFTEASDFSYLELLNIQEEPVPLGQMTLRGAISFDFSRPDVDPGSLAPGERVVLVGNPAAFHHRYGDTVPVLGSFSGNLPVTGGEVVLADAGAVKLAFCYGTEEGWPQTPRGFGFSLVLASPESNPDHRVAARWRASASPGGSPGAPDPESGVLPVYIQEIRAREQVLDTYYRITAYPLTPAEAPTEFVTTFASDMAAEPYHFSFIHLVSPDFVGHTFDWGSPEQDDSIRAVDVDLGRILDLVDNDSALRGRTVILLTADHGGGGVLSYHHSHIDSPLNFTIPFHAWGPGIPGGVDLYDLNEGRRLRPDPETNPPYGVESASMPIRNGDLGNLVLDLMGLPAIPGSWINRDQSLQTGADRSRVDHVIAISVDGLSPESIRRLGVENLPHLFRLRREGAYTDNARTDVDFTLTNPNHTSMLTSRGTLDHPVLGAGHRVTFNSSVSETLESWGGAYVHSVFNVIKAAGKISAFYSNKNKLDFLGRSFGAVDADVIELHNPNPVRVDIGGWRLTDDPEQPHKFVIPPGSVVPAGGSLLLRGDPWWRSPMRPTPTTAYFGSAFNLEPSDVSLYLFSASPGSGALTGFDHGVSHRALLHGSTLARQVMAGGAERFYLAQWETLGAANAAPILSPLVVTEVSTDLGQGFVELRNLAPGPMTLGPGWSLSGFYAFDFPEGFVLEPGQMVVVAEDPDGLAAQIDSREGVLVAGPLVRVAVKNPDPDAGVSLRVRTGTVTGGIRMVEVDGMKFQLDADRDSGVATGHTWERRSHRGFGGDPANWRSSPEAGGTPGRFLHGRYEEWVAVHFPPGGGSTDLAGPWDDPDRDGSRNLLEYGLATDPLDAGAFAEPAFREDLVLGESRFGTLSFRRPAVINDLVYVIELSSDLISWRPAGVDEVSEAAQREPTREAGVEVEVVTQTIRFGAETRYARLKLTSNPG